MLLACASMGLFLCGPQVKFFRGEYQDLNFFSQVPMQVAAEREIARLYFEKVPPLQLADIL